MSQPTIEELQTELQEVVTKHNQANEVINQCRTRFAEIKAILDYIGASATPVTTPDQPTTTES